MAARIVETSLGTKKGAKQALQRIKKGKKKQFQWLMYRYWLKVYQYALEECPVGTPLSTGIKNYMGGSLRASIRISRTGKSGEGKFGVSRAMPDDTRWEYYITAGGQGVINPNYGRVVDYAAAVHDGYLSRSGRFIAPNPFLNRAIMRAEGEFREMSRKMMDWVEREWTEGGLRAAPPKGYHVTTRIGEGGQ